MKCNEQFDWADRNCVLVTQGQHKISADPSVIFTTILGSCVSVCVFDVECKTGGINHFLLADSGDSETTAARYGAYAMEMLINALLRRGVERGRLVAKVFGGSAVTSSSEKIGESNARFAKDYLRTESIPCVAESLGGEMARRVHFHPASGRARQFMVPPMEAELPKMTPKTPDAEGPRITLF